MIDIGQGDSLLVISPAGFVMLVDSGQESQYGSLSGYLASIGITELDYTVVSHMHADHVGGMDLAIGDLGAAACFDHGASFSTNEFDEYDAAAAGRRVTVAVDDSIDMGAGVTIDVLHADTGNSSNENLNSVVLRLTHGDVSFLLGGDCEGPCEAALEPGLIDVYKVHHHGSSDSSTEACLDEIDPWPALSRAGLGNSFGHPEQVTLDRLADQEATVYRTDVDGDLVVVSDGAAYTVNGEPVCLAGETRTCGTTDVGACSFGQHDCAAGMWGACTGVIDPVTEDCGNGLDDDCDGLTDAADPQCAAGAADILIAQVAYDTPGDDALEEFVDLFNPTGSDVPLDGWSLADNASTWNLPDGLSVPAGGYLSIARNSGGFEALYGVTPDASGMTLGLGNTGDRLVLYDDWAVEVDHVAWEGFDLGWSIVAATGNSIERGDPTVDSDTVADWSVTSPAAPRGGAESTCGNGVCDPGEDCTTCGDCPGRTSGKPALRYCCGNGACESAGEDASVCPVDCAP